MLPLLPVFYLFALGSLQTLSTHLSIKNLHTARIPLLLLALTLPMSLIHNAYRVKVPFRQARQAEGRGFIDFSVGSQYLKNHAGPRDIIMTSSPLERHIHHNRPTVNYGDFSTINKDQAQYVFIGPDDPNTPNSLDPTSAHALAQIQAHPNRFELVRADSTKSWYIYQVSSGN